MRAVSIFAALILAAPAFAQPAPPPPHGGMGMPPRGSGPNDHGPDGRGPALRGGDKPVVAGSYLFDPEHTQVAFAVSHMGISPYAGSFAGATGSLTIDPANPDAARVTVNIPIASVTTNSAKLTEELKSPDWFGADKFPVATFTSTAVRTRGQGATIEGTLLLHGVKRPVTIQARLFGSATNPMSKAPSIGFVGRAVIRRSDFGVNKYVPLVSDEVELVINAAFEKDGPAK